MKGGVRERDDQADPSGRTNTPEDLRGCRCRLSLSVSIPLHRWYHDPIIAYTRVASSLEEAIERACAGRTAEGRKFRHDQYLNKWPIKDLYERLKKRQHLLRTARDFDDLHDRIHLLSPKGVGHLKIFNVTMRVGAYLNIDLDRSSFVYLHRGVLVGWQKMTGQRARPYRVPIGDMPAALQAMPHFMIEDSYCEYREWLRPGVLMQEPA